MPTSNERIALMNIARPLRQLDIGVLALDAARNNGGSNRHARRKALALLEPFTAIDLAQTAKVTAKGEKRTHYAPL